MGLPSSLLYLSENHFFKQKSLGCVWNGRKKELHNVIWQVYNNCKHSQVYFCQFFTDEAGNMSYCVFLMEPIQDGAQPTYPEGF